MPNETQFPVMGTTAKTEAVSRRGMVTALGAGGLTAALLAACGPVRPAEAPKPADQNVKLVIWHGFGKVGQDAIEKPWQTAMAPTTLDISFPTGVPLQKLLTALTAGETIDILPAVTWDVAVLAINQAALPLEPLIARTKGFELKHYFAGAVESGRWQGKLYALPVQNFVSQVGYNRALIRGAGLEDPVALFKKRQWTWSKYLEYGLKLTSGSGENRVFGLLPPPRTLKYFYAYIRGFGGEVFSPDYKQLTLNAPVLLPLYEHVRDGHRNGQMAQNPDGTAAADTAPIFRKHKAAFVFPMSRVATYPDDVPQVAAVTIPIWPSGKELTRQAVQGLALHRGSKHQQRAWEALVWASDAGNEILIAQDKTTFPVNRRVVQSRSWKDALRPEYEDAEVLTRSAETAWPGVQPPGYGDVDNQFTLAYNEIVRGAPIKQTLDELKRVTDPILERGWSGVSEGWQMLYK